MQQIGLRLKDWQCLCLQYQALIREHYYSGIGLDKRRIWIERVHVRFAHDEIVASVY